MYTMFVHLFGQFRIQLKDGVEVPCKPGKGQELLAYLLLSHPRIQARETLATLLWEQVPTAQALKYLRQTLWQVRGFLEAAQHPDLLIVDIESVAINREVPFWLDVVAFRQLTERIKGVAGHDLSSTQFADLEQAVKVYHADLLEGWYHEWCIYEREYLQRMVLIALDKLIGYCGQHHHYEAGIHYGERTLRYDCAHERTHRGLMRLYYLAGDRTAAIRQYQRCCNALNSELGVEPAESTRLLYEQIRSGQLQVQAVGERSRLPREPQHAAIGAAIADVLERLQHIQALMAKSE